MATVFITFLHSISIKPLEDWNPYEKDIQDEFPRIWDKVCDEWGALKELPEKDIWKYKLGNDDISTDCGNLYTIYFEDDKELPEDSFTFLKMLQDKCIKAGLKIAIMDKVTRQREILE